jgi:phosphoribosylanthranilate isomerase
MDFFVSWTGKADLKQGGTVKLFAPEQDYILSRGFVVYKGALAMVKIKMCGMRTYEAAKAAEDAGAGYIGFIFCQASRRYLAPEQAAVIGRKLTKVKKVGVFVDEDINTVNCIAAVTGIDYVQLHGHESPDYARRVEKPVIKAFRWRDDFSAARANAYPAAIILLDSFQQGMAGGTGRTFAWQEAAAEAQKLQKPFFVAGGIAASNAGQAIKAFHPYGLDISGGLETEGQKDISKISNFMKTIGGKCYA